MLYYTTIDRLFKSVCRRRFDKNGEPAGT